MHHQPPQIRPQTISPDAPHFSPTKKVCSPQQQETKNRAFPRLDHYPKCSFHKDMRFPCLRDTRDQGIWVHRGYSRYGQHVRYNKTIPVAAHSTYTAETSLLEGMEKGADPVGYKCRQGVSLDRGRLRRFNHDPSYTEWPRGSNTKQIFRPRY